MDKILQQCIAKILDECKKCETQEQLEEYIINPLITYIGNKLWPYIIGATLLLTMILVCLFYSIVCIKKVKKIV